MSPNQHDPAALRRELEAIPRAERLDWLAGLPRQRQTAFKRILPRDDLARLNRRIDDLERQRRIPTVESWLADARAGRANSPDAMIEVLKEVAGRLRPQDAQWIGRIETTASAGGYSKRQRAVIEGIYARYFIQ
jgi:hypothetical protein